MFIGRTLLGYYELDFNLIQSAQVNFKYIT